MTINDYLNNYPAGTEVEIYVHHDDKHRHFHPHFVEYVEADSEILNFPFEHISVELFNKEAYLDRWDVDGYCDEDCVADNTLICFLYNSEYYNYLNKKM